MHKFTSLLSVFFASHWLVACTGMPALQNTEQTPIFHLILDDKLIAKKEARVEIKVPSRVEMFSAPPSYGGGPMFLKFVSDISAVDVQGRELAVKVEENKIYVSSTTSPYLLSYTYKIPQINPGEVDQSIPFLSKTRARFDNNVTFAVPEGLADVAAHLEISAPESWPVVTSWGIGRKFVIEKVSELTSGGEVFGKYEYSEQRIGETDVVFAIEGDFSRQIIKQQFKQVLEAQQQIIGPLPFPKLLVVLQTWDKNEAKGTALPGAFFVNIPRKTKLKPFNFQVVGTISHELFHEWNIRYIFPATEDGNYLFTEGFTNYFAVAALVRSSLISEELFGRFLWRYKKFLEENPKYPADFAAIQSGFSATTHNQQLVDLAYTKGLFVAILIDLALREESGGRQSIASWFALIVERYGNRKGYTVADLRSTLGEISGRPEGKTVKVFDQTFIGGTKLDLAKLIQRFGIRCSKKDVCKLEKLSSVETLLRSKIFSARR